MPPTKSFSAIYKKTDCEEGLKKVLAGHKLQISVLTFSLSIVKQMMEFDEGWV